MSLSSKAKKPRFEHPRLPVLIDRGDILARGFDVTRYRTPHRLPSNLPALADLPIIKTALSNATSFNKVSKVHQLRKISKYIAMESLFCILAVLVQLQLLQLGYKAVR